MVAGPGADLIVTDDDRCALGHSNVCPPTPCTSYRPSIHTLSLIPAIRASKLLVVVNAYSSRTVASLQYDHVWWIFSTGQLVACCCCPCVAGQSTGCWDGLWATLPALVREMAESQIDITPECLVGIFVFNGGNGNVTEDGDPTPDIDRCALRPRSS